MHHPKGLWVLFIAEMWERFSYYGMRALLVLYLISSTSEELAGGAANLNPGFGWSEESAYLLYGIYTWAVYLTPIAGGWLADRFLGTHRSMIVGGWIIAAGHILLAGTELFGITAGAAVTLQTGPGALLCFVGGLALIVIGTGFFKPCVSVMVGQLYGPNDERRDGGFTIFYMGINVGALLAPLIAGTLGETVGWHWGFGSAAIGMILGITALPSLPFALSGGHRPAAEGRAQGRRGDCAAAAAEPRGVAAHRRHPGARLRGQYRLLGRLRASRQFHERLSRPRTRTERFGGCLTRPSRPLGTSRSIRPRSSFSRRCSRGFGCS